MILKFVISGQTLKRVDKEKPVANSQGYLKTQFELPTEYTGTISALFKRLQDGVKVASPPVTVIDGMCNVPAEIIKESGNIYISLSATDTDLHIPTNDVTVPILPCGETDELLREPDGTPNQYASFETMHSEVLSKSAEVEANAIDAINAAEYIKNSTGGLAAILPVIKSNLKYQSSGCLFASYSYVEPNSLISTFRGFSTCVSCNGETISGVKTSFIAEFTGYSIKCAIRKIDNTEIASAVNAITRAGWQTMLFIFDVPVTVNDTDIRISIEIVEINGCRLNIGFTENSDRVSADADHPNMYLILDNADWHNMGDPYNFYTPAFDILGKDNLIISTAKTIDISNRNNNYTLPPKIYSVVGKEINVYFDNLVGDSIKNYLVDVNCDVGIQQNERWTFIPNEAGTWQLSITFYDQFLNIINTANSTMLVTLPDAETGENSKCLFIGDSTTEAAVYTAELLKLFNNNITLIGTKGIAPNLFEATGGWTVDIHYSSALSSFVFDGVFNFTRYMTSNNFTTIDWIFIHLGINDVFNCADDLSVDTVINNNYTKLENMIASMKQFNTNVKIGYMLTIPPSANQDAFGKNYLCNTTQWRYKRNIHRYTVAMLNNFRDREGENIYLIPTNCNLDTEHNMSAETVPINSRNASTIVRQNNGVHPDLAGYYQMADTVYYALKNI